MTRSAKSSSSPPGSPLKIRISIWDPAWRNVLPQPALTSRKVVKAAFRKWQHTTRSALSSYWIGSKALPPARHFEISLVLANDAKVQALNRDYRGQDKPTNVLSFALEADQPGPIDNTILPLGDIILARETVVREARIQGKEILAHFSHLIVHGLLHLCGMDHQTADEASEMEALERTILAELGLPDPYTLTDTCQASASKLH